MNRILGGMAALVLAFAADASAATDVKVDFVLKTTDDQGEAITQNRFYYVYRPDKLSKDHPAPMVLVFECRGGDLPAKFFHRKADEAGFVLVSCAIQGNSSGNTCWVNGNPRDDGCEDLDYTTAVIDRVSADENCRDAFVCGISKGGHMTCCYACERPGKIRAAADLDEFMGVLTNVPTAPVPMIFFHGTKDGAVPYAMVKDTADRWREMNGLAGATPVTTFECSVREPGSVTQATWEGPKPVAFVTIVGGTHTWPSPWHETGFDVTDGIWAFFSRFVTPDGRAPQVLSKPHDNVQPAGQPASFRVSAAGEAPMTYQWQKNGKDVPGATASVYTTPPVAKEDDGAVYRVVVTNAAGAAMSDAATLKVVDAPAGPKMTQQPKDLAEVAGKPAMFSVAAEGATLRYQWQKNGMDIVGATGASLTVPACVTADSGAAFRVVVSDERGASTSMRATLTVKAAPGAPVVVEHPGRARLHPGETATFSVRAKSDTPMTYQWQSCRLNTNYVDIPGATAPTYSPPPAKMGDHRTLFRCILYNASGATSSSGEMLLVTPAGK